MLLAYFALGVCLTVAAGGFVAVWLYTPTVPSPLVTYGPCRMTVAPPTPVYYCKGDGHAWAIQDGGPVDLGPVTPIWTPAR